jgi:hypothetical protein
MIPTTPRTSMSYQWSAPVALLAVTLLTTLAVAYALALHPSPSLAESGASSSSTLVDCTNWAAVAAPALPNETSYLNSIEAISGSDIWAVGVRGTRAEDRALAIHWDGSQWSTSTLPGSDTNPVPFILNDVDSVAANDVWAVGYFVTAGEEGVGRTLAYHWNGTQWTGMSPPNVGESDNYLVGVTAISANDVWAVGDAADADDIPRSLVMHWDGSPWTIVPSPNVGAEANILYRAVALSTSDIWAIGFHEDETTGERQTLIVRWNGTQWSVVPSPSRATEDNTLVDVTAISPNDIWAVGYRETTTESQPLILHWNGTDWRSVPTSDLGEGDANLFDVVGFASNDVWAVGSQRNEEGTFDTLSLHWDGTLWNVVPGDSPSLDGNQLYGLAAVSPTELWAVGYLESDSDFHMLIEHTSVGPCVTPTVRPTRTAEPTEPPRPTRPPATITPPRPTVMPPPVPVPGTNSTKFPETGKTVKGLFLDYWKSHGGLAQQGYPISELMGEVSDLNGKPYSVQYFERAVFEYHPENKAPFNVLLSQLGRTQYTRKYPNGAPNQKPNTTAGSVLFKETGKRVGGKFLAYWNKNGGLAQQGYPLSDEFVEVSETNGKPYTVQYFERAVFEYHPENKPPYDVLLSLLGTSQFNRKYGNTPPSGTLLGQTLEFAGAFGDGRLKGTVTDVKEMATLPHEGQTLKAVGKYVVVFMDVENIGDIPAEVGSFGFLLLDNKGRSNYVADDIDAHIAVEDLYDRPGTYSEIDPGDVVPSVFVFDMPADATGYILVPDEESTPYLQKLGANRSLHGDAQRQRTHLRAQR